MLNAFVDMGGKQCKYEREVVIRGQIEEMYAGMAREVGKDINQALGGKLFWNETLGYVDGELVAEPDIAAPQWKALPSLLDSATASMSALHLAS
jgi:hypothetical protein